jgi:hypothetical protein
VKSQIPASHTLAFVIPIKTQVLKLSEVRDFAFDSKISCQTEVSSFFSAAGMDTLDIIPPNMPAAVFTIWQVTTRDCVDFLPCAAAAAPRINSS